MRQRLRTVFTLDLRSIALFRIGLSLCLLLDLFLRSFDLRAFYTDEGVLSRADWLEIAPKLHWSLHAASGDAWFQSILFIATAMFALCLLFGYRTRLMTFLCWAMTVSLLNRNTYISQAGDELLVILLFWAMFLPLHARYSVDAALSYSKTRSQRDKYYRQPLFLGRHCRYHVTDSVSLYFHCLAQNRRTLAGDYGCRLLRTQPTRLCNSLGCLAA